MNTLNTNMSHTHTEVRRVQKPNRYSLNLNIPRDLARILSIDDGDLMKFSVIQDEDNSKLIVQKVRI